MPAQDGAEAMPGRPPPRDAHSYPCSSMAEGGGEGFDEDADADAKGTCAASSTVHALPALLCTAARDLPDEQLLSHCRRTRLLRPWLMHTKCGYICRRGRAQRLQT